MPSLPVVFREGAGQFVFNVDYFDWAAGAGYKKYYLYASDDSVGTKYGLTTDSGLISDNHISNVGGNATDVDFDLTFNNPITIANALCTLSYTVFMSADDASDFTVAWTIYHVRGATETSIGTITDSTTLDGDPTNRQRRTVQLTLTKKHFKAGDVLRVNAVITSDEIASACNMQIDPSGHITDTDVAGGTCTSSAVINIPFEIQP